MATTFKLLGHGMIFQAVKLVWLWDEIATVTGISLDGRHMTTARVCDCIFFDDEA